MCIKSHNRYTRCNHSLTITTHCTAYLSKPRLSCEKTKSRDTYFSLCPKCRGVDETEIRKLVAPVAESSSSSSRVRSRLGMRTGEDMERAERTKSEVTGSTLVESVNISGPGYGRSSEPAPARGRERERVNDEGLRVQVVDSREERIDAQGFRFREIRKVDEPVIGSEPKEKRRGLRKIVGGLGFGIGAKKDRGKEKATLRNIVDMAMEKEKDREKQQKEKDKEEAYAQAAIKWAEQERELQAQGHTLPRFQSPIQSPTHTVSSWTSTPEAGSARSSHGQDSRTRSGSPGYRRPIRTVTQTSWTEPEEGGRGMESLDRETDRDAGGSLRRTRGVRDERVDGGRVLERDGDTATILTTWSKVLPRRVIALPSSGDSGSEYGKDNQHTVAEYLKEDADLVPMGLF